MALITRAFFIYIHKLISSRFISQTSKKTVATAKISSQRKSLQFIIAAVMLPATKDEGKKVIPICAPQSTRTTIKKVLIDAITKENGYIFTSSVKSHCEPKHRDKFITTTKIKKTFGISNAVINANTNNMEPSHIIELSR